MTEQIIADLDKYGIYSKNDYPENFQIMRAKLAARLTEAFNAQGWTALQWTRGIQIELHWARVGPAQVLSHFEPIEKGASFK